MKQYLDLTTWILLFAMAPLTILILLSQNTIPGDLFYPVKRGMENVILAGASVNPSTKVAFRTDLTERRFSEAQKLFSIKADTTAFSDFVTEVSTTQEDLSSFQNQQQKIELSDKLIAKIDEYQNQLTQVQTQVQIAQASSPQNIAIQITPAPTQPTAQPSQNQTPIPVQTTQPSSVQPVVTPTSQPIQIITPTEQPSVPSTPIPTIQPQAVSTIANNPIKAEEVKQEITRTHENLEKIKEKLREQKENAEVKEKIREEIQKQKEEREKFKEEQKRSQEESKKRGERGRNGENND